MNNAAEQAIQALERYEPNRIKSISTYEEAFATLAECLCIQLRRLLRMQKGSLNGPLNEMDIHWMESIVKYADGLNQLQRMMSFRPESMHTGSSFETADSICEITNRTDKVMLEGIVLLLHLMLHCLLQSASLSNSPSHSPYMIRIMNTCNSLMWITEELFVSIGKKRTMNDRLQLAKAGKADPPFRPLHPESLYFIGLLETTLMSQTPLLRTFHSAKLHLDWMKRIKLWLHMYTEEVQTDHRPKPYPAPTPLFQQPKKKNKNDIHKP
ncbi:hypothetical protein [Paenibacillus sp. YIM B09110]|uniref:hypothetical protein n=1 Tax=Paenibacillus sp. YIM B09110 TaxID=3126102 RepID=UPI00301E3A05